MTTLETRHTRGDLIEVFKICRGFEDVNFDLFFKRSDFDLRSHEFKLVKPRARLNLRKYSFNNRIVDEWNKLPDIIIECQTVSTCNF